MALRTHSGYMEGNSCKRRSINKFRLFGDLWGIYFRVRRTPRPLLRPTRAGVPWMALRTHSGYMEGNSCKRRSINKFRLFGDLWGIYFRVRRTPGPLLRPPRAGVPWMALRTHSGYMEGNSCKRRSINKFRLFGDLWGIYFRGRRPPGPLLRPPRAGVPWMALRTHSGYMEGN